MTKSYIPSLRGRSGPSERRSTTRYGVVGAENVHSGTYGVTLKPNASRAVRMGIRFKLVRQPSLGPRLPSPLGDSHPQAPAISALAWENPNPQVHHQRIRWLQDLRAMPADLLPLPLPSSAIELVRRQASAHDWKWSTTARHMATLQAALLHLPMYTNVSEAVNLMESAEWRQAIAAARRFEKESIAQPPDPVTATQIQRALRLLRGDPEPQACLHLMWVCAARVGDILKARVNALAWGTPVNDELQRFTLTIREGKRARFRGPYSIPSVLPRARAAQLQTIMSRRSPNERIFMDHLRIRTAMRTAIQQQVNPQATLASVRKGATHIRAAKRAQSAAWDSCGDAGTLSNHE
eukprot:gene1896-biopygen1572